MYLIKVDNQSWRTNKLYDVSIDIVMYFYRRGYKEMPKVKGIYDNGVSRPHWVDGYQDRLDSIFFQIMAKE